MVSIIISCAAIVAGSYLLRASYLTGLPGDKNHQATLQRIAEILFAKKRQIDGALDKTFHTTATVATLFFDRLFGERAISYRSISIAYIYSQFSIYNMLLGVLISHVPVSSYSAVHLIVLLGWALHFLALISSLYAYVILDKEDLVQTAQFVFTSYFVNGFVYPFILFGLVESSSSRLLLTVAGLSILVATAVLSTMTNLLTVIVIRGVARRLRTIRSMAIGGLLLSLGVLFSVGLFFALAYAGYSFNAKPEDGLLAVSTENISRLLFFGGRAILAPVSFLAIVLFVVLLNSAAFDSIYRAFAAYTYRGGEKRRRFWRKFGWPLFLFGCAGLLRMLGLSVTDLAEWIR